MVKDIPYIFALLAKAPLLKSLAPSEWIEGGVLTNSHTVCNAEAYSTPSRDNINYFCHTSLHGKEFEET